MNKTCKELIHLAIGLTVGFVGGVVMLWSLASCSPEPLPSQQINHNDYGQRA